jgi:hypothetical protein
MIYDIGRFPVAVVTYLKSGTEKPTAVEPPYVNPITLYSAAYVAELSDPVPSHNNHPAGATFIA